MFGCKTVVFKMDKGGNCVYVKRTNIATVRDLPMHGWTDTQFRRMAVSSIVRMQANQQMLSGCDYLPSIVGIGLKKAHRLLRRLKTVERVSFMHGVRQLTRDRSFRVYVSMERT